MRLSVILKGIKNSSYLTLSNVYVQGITAISFLIIPGLLGPTQYGEYIIALTYASFFDIFTSVGLNKVAIREGCLDRDNVVNVFQSLDSLKLFLLLCGIALTVISSLFSNYSNHIRVLIFIAGIDVFFTGLYRYRSSIFIIFQDFKFVSILNSVAKTLFYVMAIVWVINGGGVIGILFSLAISAVIMVFLTEKVSLRYIKPILISKPVFNWTIIKQTLVFSLIGFLSIASTKLTVLVLSSITEPSEVGIFGLAQKIVEQGMILIGILSSGFLPIFIDEYKNNNKNPLNLLYLAIIILFSGTLIVYILNFPIINLINLIYGDKFNASLEILNILLYNLVFSFCLLPFSLLAQATFNEVMMLYAYLILSIFTVLSILLVYPAFGLKGVAYSNLILNMALTFFLIITIFIKVYKKYFENTGNK